MTPRSGDFLLQRLDALSVFSSEAGALTRLYLTREHKAAAFQVKQWMFEAGMTVALDAAGSVVGRYPARTADAPALILGSHIDTVRHAGRFDGNLGVVAAIEAVATLHAAGERLPFAIEVVAFGDEEGVRFPVTLTGSRALAGTFDPRSLDSIDEAGTSLRQALVEFGCDPASIPAAARRRSDAVGYVELHIEQGPVLEQEGLPVGVVTAIAGASRLRVEVRGVAGHAGTVPMHLRRDASMAAAEMELAVERIAVATPDLVGTVGRIDVAHAAVNVIPAHVSFTVDIRSPHDATRTGAIATLQQQFDAIAARRGVTVTTTCFYEQGAAPCAPWLIEALAAAVAEAGVTPRFLPSGAGHDGLAMIALCPIAMLFVRCAGGVSHNPIEDVTAADIEIATTVLLGFLRRLRPAARML